MTRLQMIATSTAPETAKELLQAVEEHLGLVPNFIRVLAGSPAALKGYLAFARTLAEESALDPVLSAQVELCVSEFHGCEYGKASYGAVARRNGLSEEQLADGRRGHSPNRRHEAALAFCLQVLEQRGRVDDAGIERLRRLQFTDGQIVELVAVSCLAAFTNTLNHVAGTELDFPAARALPHF